MSDREWVIGHFGGSHGPLTCCSCSPALRDTVVIGQVGGNQCSLTCHDTSLGLKKGEILQRRDL